ncbi:MAG: glycoside hydrolase domain-containing protein [Candidatus Aminicenantales bacterium]
MLRKFKVKKSEVKEKWSRARSRRFKILTGELAAILFLLATVFSSANAAFLIQGGEKYPCREASTAWNPDSGLGNHRAVVTVKQASGAVFVHLPWRRPDSNPGKKKVLVVEARSGKFITNVWPLKVNNDCGDFVFEASEAPGDYYFYYLPYKIEGKSYPVVTYLAADYQPEKTWLERYGLSPVPGSKFKPSSLPRAELIAFEAVDDFSRFYPMEVIATSEETAKIIETYKSEPFLIFPEDREHPVRMFDYLPLRWVEAGPQTKFEASAVRGEYFVFQLGLFAHCQNLEKIKVVFSDLVNQSSGKAIRAEEASCFNSGGLGWDSQPLEKELSLAQGKVQPLWCGIQIPENIPPGDYVGEVAVSAANLLAQKISLKIKVEDKVLSDSGDSELWRQSRLRWLNSQLAVNNEVVKPYRPLEVKGRTIKCLGRTLTLGENGLPVRIESFFTPELTAVSSTSTDLLSRPFEFLIKNSEAPAQSWKNESFVFTKITPGKVAWQAVNKIPALDLTVKINGAMEFDGYVEFKVKVEAGSETGVDDICLVIPFRPETSTYMMGLGFKGGRRPSSFSWRWDRSKNQDALWIGAVNAGLQCQLRAENYSRPLNTNFYQLKPLNLPPSWWNEGRGSVRVEEAEVRDKKRKKEVVLAASSGPRQLKKGEVLYFNFNLLLTPFKPINPGKHFSERYYHAFKPVSEIAATGANVINVHHATEINPFINYPFLRLEKMKAYLDEAHRQGLKVKIYYTIRELSNRATELFALESLNHEIFTPGQGGGYSWLQEHLHSGYIAGWFVPELKDAAIINSGMSRWHNYYIEGLAWLAKNAGIDGLYLDDVAFDRVTMKRVRKVLETYRPAALIDLHSANQYNPRDGYASSTNLYLEHFPYLDRLWFGEYFDYNSQPDYWLIEISGIPFGLMGEMLEKGGNPWRGMIYGMTARLPWAGDPRPLWKAWDDFGLTQAGMIGYWSPNCPVKTSEPQALATVYRQKGKAMVALASWSEKTENCRLFVDWKKLGLDPQKVTIEAPAIENFQPARTFKPGEEIPVEPGQGWLLIFQTIQSD